MSTKASITNDQFYGQVSESIKMVFDLTSRIDERVKMLMEGQNDIESRINKLIETNQKTTSDIKDEINDISEKVAIMENYELADEIEKAQNKMHLMEIRLENLDHRIGSHDKSWSKIFDTIWKLALMLIAGFILYKLGIQAPPS